MKKAFKILKVTALVFAAIIIVDVFYIFSISEYRPEIGHSDAIIVLGAAINTPAIYNRSLEGLRLYNQGKADVLVLSGGRISSKFISEAQNMKNVISVNSQVVPPMILEENSHTTYENINNAKAKIPDAKSVILVSDGFHLGRAVLMAKRAGFEKVYWSSPKPAYYKKSELAFYYFRESVAMLSYIPKFVFN